jgi:hypothetical protein
VRAGAREGGQGASPPGPPGSAHVPAEEALALSPDAHLAKNPLHPDPADIIEGVRDQGVQLVAHAEAPVLEGPLNGLNIAPAGAEPVHPAHQPFFCRRLLAAAHPGPDTPHCPPQDLPPEGMADGAAQMSPASSIVGISQGESALLRSPGG